MQETLVPGGHRPSLVELPEPGYRLADVIGRGGMGEVIAAHDQRIGREVAIKRMHGAGRSADSISRFLREARIQARLDHPAIVPVYELSTDTNGQPYFTMKRLSGTTLSAKLAAKPALQPMLRAFVDVCLAIEFAHSRRVVHRDLKPSNIMLGEFGEVYVLDWGIARELDDQSTTRATSASEAADAGVTATGALLGTPGYMSPEQVRGDEIGPSADVYALGAILFEILAGEPLHPRGEGALANTLVEPQARPGTRRPDRVIPPELDDACFSALAEVAADRPTARVLAERVQRYLDGDRDVERRRALAASLVANARAELASNASDARATAMRSAGHALVLDPASSDAGSIVASLMLEPPAELPPQLAASLEQEDRELSSERSRQGAFAYLSVFAFVPIILFVTVSSWPWFVAFVGVHISLALLAWRSARRGVIVIPAVLVGNVVLAIVWSRIAGPFMLTPVMTCGVVLALSASAWLNQRPAVLLAWVLAMALIPEALELAGVLSKSYEVSDSGQLITHSTIFGGGGVAEVIALVATNVGFLLVVCIYAIAFHRTRRAAQRELHIRMWHLRQLLPGQAMTDERPARLRRSAPRIAGTDGSVAR